MTIRYRARRRSSRIFAQEDAHSCGAACARQLLADANIHLSESKIRDEADFIPAVGTWAPQLARALSMFHRVKYSGGMPYASPETLRAMVARGGVLVQLRRHWVIADSLLQEVVSVRDPHPFPDGDEYGSEGDLSWSEFMALWREGQHQMVWRRK